ncbi:hypothetical protein OROMI_000474 [Orobanche minor]
MLQWGLITWDGGKLSIASATVFTFQNSCSYTIWPGTLSGNGAALLGDGGFALPPGAAVQLSAPPGWSGRFWARTGCNYDDTGNGQCATGDVLKCTGGGAPPVSLVEFTLGGGGNKDFYDVSLVDGYNVGMGVRPSGGAGDCQYAGCVADLKGSCPRELQVADGGGAVVACKSACAAFNTPEFCEHSKPETCSPMHYSEMFKVARRAPPLTVMLTTICRALALAPEPTISSLFAPLLELELRDFIKF